MRLAPWREPLIALAAEIGSTVAFESDPTALPAQDERDRRRGRALVEPGARPLARVESREA
jgi:hypothetical protein